MHLPVFEKQVFFYAYPNLKLRVMRSQIYVLARSSLFTCIQKFVNKKPWNEINFAYFHISCTKSFSSIGRYVAVRLDEYLSELLLFEVCFQRSMCRMRVHKDDLAYISVAFYLVVQCTTLTVCFLLRTGRQAVCVDRKVVPRSREQGGPFRHDVRALVRTLSTTQTGLGKGKQIKYIVFNPRLKPRILYLLDLNQGQIK